MPQAVALHSHACASVGAHRLLADHARGLGLLQDAARLRDLHLALLLARIPLARDRPYGLHQVLRGLSRKGHVDIRT